MSTRRPRSKRPAPSPHTNAWTSIIQSTPFAKHLLDTADDPTTMSRACIADGIAELLPGLSHRLTPTDMDGLVAWTNTTYRLGMAVGIVQGIRVRALAEAKGLLATKGGR